MGPPFTNYPSDYTGKIFSKRNYLRRRIEDKNLS